MSNMSYDTFDNDAESTTDEEYIVSVEWLSARTAEELRQAGTDVSLQKQALCRYWKRGYRANLTSSELIDFLGVSSPCILDAVGYSDEEGDALMSLSDSLMESDIDSVSLSDHDSSTQQLPLCI